MKIIELNENRVFNPSTVWMKIIYQWDEELSTTTPFWVSTYQSKLMEVERNAPFPYKEIWFDHNRLAVVAVRTDEYPLMWLWWWVWIRIEESTKLTSHWLIYLLGIWGLISLKRFEVPTWKAVWKQWTKTRQ